MNNNGQANGLFQDPDNILLRTLFWNADGLTNDKFTEFKHIVIANNIDVYASAEAGASTDNEQYFQLPGYQTYVLKRTRPVASGLLVAAKNTHTVVFKILKAMTDDDKMELIEFDLWKDGAHRRFLITYNPPKNILDLRILENSWTRQSILMGDLNAHSSLWGFINCPTGKIFEDFISSNPVQFIDNEAKDPTFLSYSGATSHPDVVLVHSAISTTICHTLLPSPSGFGHKVLSVDLIKPQTLHKKSSSAKNKWNFKKADWKQYLETADNLVTKELISNNVDKSFARIREAIMKSAKRAIPRGKVKCFKPYWTNELQSLKEERDIARESVERTGSREDRYILKQKTLTLRKRIIHAKRESYRKFLSNLDFRKDGVKAHRFISNLNNNSEPKKKNPFVVGQKMLTKDTEIAGFFCKHYAKRSNFCPCKEGRLLEVKPIANCPTEDEIEVMYRDFEISELNLALSETATGKSPGPDEIQPEFLTHLGDRARMTILAFLNKVWGTHYPCEWRKAEIVPIPKKGKEPNTPANFRPISLTSVLSKVYERMILRRLMIVIERYHLLSERQAGFRSHRETIEQVARLSQEIKDGFHRKQSTLAVFVDFHTAFDKVWRRKLLSKLQPLGIKGNMYKALSSFLAQRYIRVKYNESASPFRQTKQGLPQGSVISPALFNLMINDAIDEIQSIPGIQTLLYADDLVIWATSSSITALETAVNEALAKLSHWTKENELPVNTEKSEFQLFTLSTKQHQDLNLLFDATPLRETKSSTYLGVQLDTKLQWTKHVDQLVQKSNKRMGLLKRLVGTTWGATESVLAQAYTAYVRPVLEYGNELVTTASVATLDKIDKAQNQVLRLITGAPRSTNINAMELQTGIDPLSVRRDIAALSLMERIHRLNINYWTNYKPPTQRLKTQKSFSVKAAELAGLYDVHYTKRNVFPATSTKDIVMDHRGRRKLDLLFPVSKNETPPAMLKAIALETIYTRYPSPNWLHIYTDGSARDAQGNGGAGVYSEQFQISEPVGILASNFDGEIRAILLALQQLVRETVNNAVLFVDSQAAILALTSESVSDSTDVRRAREVMFDLITAGWRIILQWIPSHCGIRGNEEADRLAKQGTQQQQPQPSLDYDTSKRLLKGALKREVHKRHTAAAEGKQWSSLTEPGGRLPHDLPRNESVACFRLLTGHDYLQAHLHRIGVAESPFCTLCNLGDRMNVAHLNVCDALLDQRLPHGQELNFNKKSKLYWAARRRMTISQQRLGIG